MRAALVSLFRSEALKGVGKLVVEDCHTLNPDERIYGEEVVELQREAVDLAPPSRAGLPMYPANRFIMPSRAIPGPSPCRWC